MNATQPTPTRGVLLSVFLISLASLALEILQMRIFAFALWHHLAFLVVSIAILGFGAAGAFLASVRPLQKVSMGNSLAVPGILFALTAVLGPFFLADRAIDIFGQVGGKEVSQVLLYYLVFTLPYFFAGYIISIALTREARFVSRLYFVNMVGSGLGCFAIFATLKPLGAEGSLFLVAGTGGLIALLAARGKMLQILGGLVCLACLGILPWADQILTLKVAGSKLLAMGQRIQGTETLVTQWTPLSRIDMLKNPGFDGLYIFQDGDAPAPMPSITAPLALGEIHAISYIVKKEPSVLIIGVGGGFDVKIALENKAKEIVGVEINPTTLDIYRDPRFAKVTGETHKLKNVKLYAAEGRHFIRSSEKKYDLIQMSGVDTYTALASGAYVLSESYLYTLEAFRDYLEHLTPDGMFSIIRFAFPAPRETLRIMVLACQALKDRGAKEPWKHIIVIRGAVPDADKNPFTTVTGLGAILVKKCPFTQEELDKLREWATVCKHVKDYFPDEDGKFTEEEIKTLTGLIHKDQRYKDYQVSKEGTSPFHAFAKALAENRTEEFLAGYPYNVRPVHDDNPFFFNQHRFQAVWDWLLGREKKVEVPQGAPWAAHTPLFQTRPVGLMLLFLTLGQLAVLVTICIFLPLLFMRRKGRVHGSVLTPMGYFFCLGLAYIFLMISAMQRFGLILGHPSYSISVTMATFLISSGLGSFVAGWFKIISAPRILTTVAALLALGSLLLHIFLPTIATALLPQTFLIRMCVTIAILFPLAFIMGMCFPTGIRVLTQGRSPLVPWAYGVNGAASVLGSVVAVLLAMTLGFANVQWVSAALYIMAALFMRKMTHEMEPEDEKTLGLFEE